MADITKYYSLTDALKQYGQVDGETNPNATTMQDMQSYMQQNGDTLENVVKAFLWQPETNVVAGQEVHSPNLPAGYMAVCTTAGTTGTTEPSWSTSYSTYTDGTVTWAITSLYSGKANKSDVVNKANDTSFTISAGEKSLVGNSDESLKWVGNSVDSIVASGDDYIRYASGLQICWKNVIIPDVTAYGDKSVNWTYPKEFISAPFITGSETSAVAMMWVYLTPYTTYANVRARSNENATLNLRISCIAIGKWK